MNDIDRVFGDDYQVEGQYSLFDFMPDERSFGMIAVSKVFARAIKQMNLTEWKAFIYALTHIRWTEENKHIVYVSKYELADVLGIECEQKNITPHLRRAIGKLHKHSEIEFSDEDTQNWESGVFLTGEGVRGDFAYIKFNPDYMKLFEELKSGDYITMWADDLFKMTSERSILFYESLRNHSDTRKTNIRRYSVKDLKTLFGMDEKAYVRKNGQFDRMAFEKYVIDPLCEDIRKSNMINLHLSETNTGKYYTKIKLGGRVRAYEFAWEISNRPAVLTGSEKAELREDIDKDPKALKILKDIEEGKKKPKKNGFHNYQEAGYDIAEIERQLLQRSYGEDSKGDGNG